MDDDINRLKRHFDLQNNILQAEQNKKDSKLTVNMRDLPKS